MQSTFVTPVEGDGETESSEWKRETRIKEWMNNWEHGTRIPRNDQTSRRSVF